MYFTDGEVYAIKQMLDGYDSSVGTSNMYEIIGVLRFKILEDHFLKESKINEVTTNQ